MLGDWLWLGCGRDAKNLAQLRQHQITHILNVSDDVPNYFEAKESHLKYLKLHVKDHGMDSGISRVFPQAFNYMLSVKNGGGRVLVHCMAGQNRSVTVVAAFLMNNENMSLKEAIRHIRTTRKTACPFRDNREELVRYETSLFGVSSMTVDDFLVPSLHRSNSDGYIDELASSACIMKAKSKSRNGVPPEFLSKSSSSLSMSSSSIPPPSCYNPYSTPNPSINSLTHSFYSMSLNDLPSISPSKFEFPKASAKDSAVGNSSRSNPPLMNNNINHLSNSTPLANSNHGSLRRAQIIEDDSTADDNGGRPRLVVTI